MKQELQNLRLARFSLYKNLYDILITKLRVHGYEPQADTKDNDGNRHINPLATRNAYQFFWPEFINNQTVRIIVDGIDVSIGMDNVSRLKAVVRMWDNLAAATKAYYKRHYNDEWTNGTYSAFRNVTRKVTSDNLAELLNKVKLLVAKSKRIQALREKEVADGRGRHIVG